MIDERYLNFRGVGHSESVEDWRKSWQDDPKFKNCVLTVTWTVRGGEGGCYVAEAIDGETKSETGPMPIGSVQPYIDERRAAVRTALREFARGRS